MYHNQKVMVMKEHSDPIVEPLATEMLQSVNKLYANRIVVPPSERKKYLTPIARLCYDPSSPFSSKGPKFFAQLLYLSVDFRRNDPSAPSLGIEEIDTELQRIKRTLNEE